MRDWLNSILGQDGGRVAQFALALVAVVLLILLLAWVIRRLQPGARLVAATGGKTRKRLGVLEASDVDARRRLVLVRRDDVEHLIMIGGPNDLLIESRILRGGAHAVARPNVQQMPRPAVHSEPERTTASLPNAAPTVPVMALPTGNPSPAPLTPRAPAPATPAAFDDDEPELPIPAPVPQFAPRTAPPPFAPPIGRAPAGPVAPTPAAEMSDRRPSLSDLLSAATAAKAADSRDLPQPMTAPPPMPRLKPPQPDLEEDDRDMPTQVVPQPHAPQPLVAAAPAPVVEPVQSRETEVATQIERALADLNPLLGAPETPAPIEAKTDTVQQPQLQQPRRSVPEPVQAPAPIPITRPTPVMAAPTMPPIPLRPTPPVRPTLAPAPERPAPPERPMLPERAALPERPAAFERPALPERPAPFERAAVPEPAEYQIQPAPVREARTEDRAPTGPSPAYAPVQAFVPEPITSPRPITAPVPRPPIAAVVEAPAPALAPAPVVAPTPAAPVRNKTDELEEEMAKLLSELGGSSSR